MHACTHACMHTHAPPIHTHIHAHAHAYERAHSVLLSQNITKFLTTVECCQIKKIDRNAIPTFCTNSQKWEVNKSY